MGYIWGVYIVFVDCMGCMVRKIFGLQTLENHKEMTKINIQQPSEYAGKTFIIDWVYELIIWATWGLYGTKLIFNGKIHYFYGHFQ